MTTRIDFYFDFSSPNCYLAYRALDIFFGDLDATVLLKPALLGGIFKATNNQPPFVAFGGVAAKIAYGAREMQRFADRYGMASFQFNPHFPINSLQLMRGLIAARRLDVETAYVEAVLAAMWERGEDAGDPAVVQEILKRAGLASDDIFSLSRDPDVKNALISATDDAVQRGVFGLPTFFVGDEMYFGKDQLHEVRKEVTALSR